MALKQPPLDSLEALSTAFYGFNFLLQPLRPPLVDWKRSFYADLRQAKAAA